MTTGWRAGRDARRPHTRKLLKRHPPGLRLSRKRRQAVKDAMRALRLKGVLK